MLYFVDRGFRFVSTIASTENNFGRMVCFFLISRETYLYLHKAPCEQQHIRIGILKPILYKDIVRIVEVELEMKSCPSLADVGTRVDGNRADFPKSSVCVELKIIAIRIYRYFIRYSEYRLKALSQRKI